MNDLTNESLFRELAVEAGYLAFEKAATPIFEKSNQRHVSQLNMAGVTRQVLRFYTDFDFYKNQHTLSAVELTSSLGDRIVSLDHVSRADSGVILATTMDDNLRLVRANETATIERLLRTIKGYRHGV